MKLYKEELYNLYIKWVDNVPDEKSTFTPKEIVNAISNIIESNPSLIELPSDEEIKEQADKIIKLWINDTTYNEGINEGFYLGVEFMKEQILNQNK